MLTGAFGRAGGRRATPFLPTTPLQTAHMRVSVKIHINYANALLNRSKIIK